MSRCFLVRHGVTDWNSEGRIQGQPDTPLNEAGHRQAHRLRLRLASVSFAAAWFSDLRRGSDTAVAILQGRNLRRSGSMTGWPTWSAGIWTWMLSTGWRG